MCQRATGGLFAALAGAPKADFAWTRGAPSFFASSNLATRGFCAACGTPLSFAYNREDARFYVTIGSLDDPALAPVRRQYGLEGKIAWVRSCEDLPAEETGVGAPDFFATMQSNQAR
jgi:hypothetical protein